MSFLAFCNRFLWGPAIPALLLGYGGLLLCKLSFFPFLHPLRTVRKMFEKETDGGLGESPLRALSLALAGTLGVGNISGVALAIGIGGAGSVFWLWLSALFAMIIRYAEIVLAMDTREKTAQGYRGGAMYYIRTCLGKKVGNFLAGLFAVLCLLLSVLMGGMLQANAVAECFSSIYGVPQSLTCALLALGIFVVLGFAKGGFSRLTAKLVPMMTAIYVAASLFLIWRLRAGIPSVLCEIFRDAFRTDSMAGGILGILLSSKLRTGVARGLISNEAGCGTAPMAHASSSTQIPAKQGLLGVFEVGTDTLFLCTLTAFVILLSFPDTVPYSAGGMLPILLSFSFGFGNAGGTIVSICILFFAFATMISWTYYGAECLSYFSSDRKKRYVFFAIYTLSLLPAGSIPSTVWEWTDFCISAMTCINLFAMMKKTDRIQALSVSYGLCSQGSKNADLRSEHRACVCQTRDLVL